MPQNPEATKQENVWKTVAEDMLIAAYVPEADTMSRSDALELALQRDAQAAEVLQQEVLSEPAF